MSNLTKVEYRVREVTRYIVTRFHSTENGAGVDQKGEYDNGIVAYEVAYALCRAEHDQLGWAPGDERITYPSPIPEPGQRAVSALGGSGNGAII